MATRGSFGQGSAIEFDVWNANSFVKLVVDAIAYWQSSQHIYVHKSSRWEHAFEGSWQSTSGYRTTFDWWVTTHVLKILFASTSCFYLVLSSVNEPLSGWVDNWNGPTGIVSAVGKGIFHTIMCNAESIADFIPVDLVRKSYFEVIFFLILFLWIIQQVINLMVAAAWKTAITKPAGMTIYNCCTGEVRPITWGRLVSLAIENMRIHPLG